MAPSRSLRIGIVLGERLVEERILDGSSPITFGQSLRCTLSVPADGVPREHLLFARDDGRFVLRATSRMTGRLGLKDRLASLDELRPGSGSDGVWTIALERGARGKLTLGDATILFQEVATPPATPRPHLPASIRGTFSDRIDRRLAVIIGGSLVVHIAIAAWAWATDVETTALGLPSVASEYHQETIDVTLPEVTPPTPAQPGIATPVTPNQVPSHHPTPPVTHAPPPTTHAPTPDLGDDALRMANILTGGETSDHGTGSMQHRQPGADLQHQLDDARNHTVEIGNSDHTSRPTEPPRPGTVPDHPIVDDPSLTHTDPSHQGEDHHGRIIPGPVQTDDPTTLTPAVVLDKINTVYMAGLQRCYRKGLSADGLLSGRVALAFTVDLHGRVSDASASGVSPQVDGCISSLMESWHFPIPKDEHGDPTDTSFKVSLALQPS